MRRSRENETAAPAADAAGAAAVYLRYSSSWRSRSVRSPAPIIRRTRHGLPAAITPEGISFVTTLPAPMMVSSPIVTPASTFTSPPSQTRLPIWIGLLHQRAAFRLLIVIRPVVRAEQALGRDAALEQAAVEIVVELPGLQLFPLGHTYSFALIPSRRNRFHRA